MDDVQNLLKVINIWPGQHAARSTCGPVNMRPGRHAARSTCGPVNMRPGQHAARSSCPDLKNNLILLDQEQPAILCVKQMLSLKAS